jgi:hypothetical protein
MAAGWNIPYLSYAVTVHIQDIIEGSGSFKVGSMVYISQSQKYSEDTLMTVLLRNSCNILVKD